MWTKLCSRPALTGIELGHDQTNGQVFVGQRQSTPAHEQRRTLDMEQEGGAVDEEVEVELDDSLSLDFSDEDIEYLSDDDGEEEEGGRTGTLKNEEVEEGAITSEIQQFKVGKGRVGKGRNTCSLPSVLTSL